jgi:serine protease Do
MNQSPVGVVQTINKVVEKTIETVTGPTKEIQTVVKETVTLNPEEQIVNAVAKNLKSVIRIYRTNTDPTANSNSMVFVGLGSVVSDDGIVITDSSLILDGGKYFTTIGDSTLLDLSVLRVVNGEQIALLKIKNDAKNPVKLYKVALSNVDPKLGQTVIYIGGETKDSVSTGIVSSLSVKETKVPENASSTPVDAKISSIETSIPSNFISGGLLLNLSGELVGVNTVYMNSSKTGLFTPSQQVKDALSALADSQKKAQ